MRPAPPRLEVHVTGHVTGRGRLALRLIRLGVWLWNGHGLVIRLATVK